MTMTSPINRRSMLIGTALLGVGGVAMARQPKPASARVGREALDRLIPTRIGDWTYRDSSGLVLPPPDALSDSLYSGLVTRNYTAPDRLPIMLLVAYSNVQDGMLQVHRPEVCYPAGGYRLSPTVVEEVPNGMGGNIPANTFSADGVSRTEQVLYWTRIGGFFPTSWFDQRVAVLRANLDGLIPDGVLVRVSTLAPDMASARADLTTFAAQMVRTSPPVARRLLVGAA
ncbi:EpsI family protein [Sphingomonas sp. MA1305]|uniref:exosortase-associated protein EpsI, V-type n=1 Tax=Sphingomonas sp. MA1305 TaxID=2479204 RepID=UPI0018DF56C9|nr:exosortase-associated protein EpsI, V-type [Sphingomonas sp. MA1305]MBI0477215.1 EpsI family protein [Sphingomonas sp. MA1305]